MRKAFGQIAACGMSHLRYAHSKRDMAEQAHGLLGTS